MIENITAHDWAVIRDALDQRIRGSREMHAAMKNEPQGQRIAEAFRHIEIEAEQVFSKLEELGLI